MRNSGGPVKLLAATAAVFMVFAGVPSIATAAEGAPEAFAVGITSTATGTSHAEAGEGLPGVGSGLTATTVGNDPTAAGLVLTAAADAQATAGQLGRALPSKAALKPGLHRLAGGDRYATAAAVSRSVYASGAQKVVLVSGLDYPDAVSAAPLAAKLGAPLLLTTKTGIPQSTLNEIQRLKPKQVIIVGGEGVVGKAVVSGLGAYGKGHERLAGSNRYQTAAAVAKFGWPDGASQAFIATGTGYADALAAAPAAAKIDAPVILVPNKTGSQLDPATSVLKTLGTSKLHIAGGTGVIPDAVRNALSTGGRTTVPYSGADRYATAAAIIKTHFSGSVSGLFWASGMNFPDALAGAAAAGATGAPLALSMSRCVPPVIGSETAKLSAASRMYLGGTWVLTDHVVAGLSCAKADNIDSASSLTVVVNKQRPLSPQNYVPSGLRMPRDIVNVNGQPLRNDAATALEYMNAAAKRAGITLTLQSGYRSYSAQQSNYNYYVATEGRASADQHTARPGHSEHQTGLALDFNDGGGCALRECFANTAAGKWLKANAHQWGFILRYDAGLQPTVGFMYEPWHYRYVGTKVALDMRAKGIPTLEQYYGLTPAPTY